VDNAVGSVSHTKMLRVGGPDRSLAHLSSLEKCSLFNRNPSNQRQTGLHYARVACPHHAVLAETIKRSRDRRLFCSLLETLPDICQHEPAPWSMESKRIAVHSGYYEVHPKWERNMVPRIPYADR
jgi:hypothetical protein